MKRTKRVRPYVEAALLVSVALILSNFTLFQMPLGGSVTLGSTIPICIASLRSGVSIGVMAGLIFGVLKFLAGGTVVGIGPFLCDYFLANIALGFTGLFYFLFKKMGSGSKSAFVSVVLAQMVRLSFHVLSGVLFFSEGLPLEKALEVSIAYNAAFLVPDVIIGLIVFSGLIKNLPKAKA
jgi:thiamine transporter